MNTDLKQIKKYYGEDMMHYARDNFSSILEDEGKLSKLFLDNFAESKTLFENLKENNELVKFKNYIYELNKDKIDEKDTKIESIKTPKELLSEAGYILYECKTEEDIQKFKKYYSKGEELCTFKGGRLDRCYVFFAVKKDVDKIKREDFKNPERQDQYGTSVISIQFSKDGTNMLSIKNRYNHRVKNPDATFGNNLDNIIEGLTKSFEVYYGIIQKFKNTEEFKRFVRANDGRLYKYNYETYGIYYCTENTIIQFGKPIKLEKEKYVVMNSYILDLQNKSFLALYSNDDDDFTNTIENIKKIEVLKKNQNKLITFKTDKEDVIIEVNRNGQIIGYINNNVTEIKDNFMSFDKTLRYLELNSVVSIGDNFLIYNKTLNSLSMKNIKLIGNDFMKFYGDSSIKKYDFPNLKKIGNGFMTFCGSGVEEINLPSIEIIGEEFFRYLKSDIKIIDFPNLKKVGNYFISEENQIEVISLPKIEFLPDYFLRANRGNVYLLNIPLCESIGNHVLTYSNVNLNNAYFNNLKKIGNSFLMFSSMNAESESLNMPNVIYIGDDVLSYVTSIKCANLPKLKRTGKYFLNKNVNFEELNIDNLEELGMNSFKLCIMNNIRKWRFLNSKDLISALKEYSKKINKIRRLKEIKNQIIQNLYIKKKVLKK